MSNPERRIDPERQAEIDEENRKLRRMQWVVNMVMATICDTNVSVEEASELIASTRNYILGLFPGKELAYDLIYRPRFQRLMSERFHLQ